MNNDFKRDNGLRKSYTDISYLKIKLWLMLAGIVIIALLKFLLRA